jgi:hypothetical protein
MKISLTLNTLLLTMKILNQGIQLICFICFFKLAIKTKTGDLVCRICPWARYTVKLPLQFKSYDHKMVFYNPDQVSFSDFFR